MQIKKIETNQENILRYINQSNVTRNTKCESNTRFGKIVVTSDADADG